MAQTGNITTEELAGRPYRVERRPGHGAPVVFASGCGLPGGIWDPVAAPLINPAILYDRPGLRTPRPDELPTLSQEVEGLRELVEVAVDEHGAPATLVAHSMASFHVEALLWTRPDLVGAVIMVDPSIEFRHRRPWNGAFGAAPGLVASLASRRVVDRAAVLGAVGLARAQTFERLSPAVAESLRTTYSNPDALAAAAAEFIAYEDQANDLLELRSAAHPPPVPTTVLSAIPRHPSEKQRRYVEFLGARHVLVQHSRHLLMVDAPRAVLAAIAAPGRP